MNTGAPSAPSSAAVPLTVAYIVMKYPTLSQTFIEREMLGLAAQGLRVEVHPCFDFRSPSALRKAGLATPDALGAVRAGAWWRFALAGLNGAVREILRRPSLAARGLRLLARHFPGQRETWFMTLWGTFFALARAAEFRRRDIAVIHGAWATAPATAAAILAELTGKPFSFGAHAYDLHRHGGDPFLGPKLRAARFVHTTTRANADDIERRFPGHRAPIILVRRGLPDLPPRPAVEPQAASGTDRIFQIVSVGRLVEKKGHIYQIAACRELLRRGRRFHLRIIGDGPLRSILEQQIAAQNLQAHVELAGARGLAEVQAAYAAADIFWHTGIVDAQGDRDGLPNVIPEAFAHALPVISSSAGGAAEAVIDGETGLLADPADPAALADAVDRLARDAALCRDLGLAGRAWVEDNFLTGKNACRLARAFREAAIRRG